MLAHLASPARSPWRGLSGLARTLALALACCPARLGGTRSLPACPSVRSGPERTSPVPAWKSHKRPVE